jgi:hypothetical protein
MKFKELLTVARYGACIALVLVVSSRPAHAEIGKEAALDGLRRHKCFWAYWGWPIPGKEGPRKNLPVTLRIEADRTHVWVDGMRSGFHPARRTGSYFELIEKYGRPFVHNRTRAMDLDNPNLAESVKRYKELVFAGPTEAARFSEPPDGCKRVFDPDSEVKQRMLRAIDRTIAYWIWDLDKRGLAEHPEPQRIVVGNFNVADQHTYVLIRSTGDIWEVTLYAGGDRSKVAERLERYGTFFAKDIRRKEHVRMLRPKILRVGLEREIRSELVDEIPRNP